MTTHWYQLTTLSPVVMSESGATLGAPTSLPFIPGAALLGAVAASTYQALLDEDPAEAVRVFHRGGVRFGDALYCLDAQHEVFPVPLSMHRPKSERGLRHWRNHAVADTTAHVPASVQPKQQRGGTLCARRISAQLHGDLQSGALQPLMQSSERTALEDGRAREGFLFSLHAIRAGQRFLCRVDLAADLSSSARDRVLSALRGTLQVGRSRSAEYGLVLVEKVVNAPNRVPLRAEDRRTRTVPLLLTSDWCLFHPQTGQPTLVLSPEHVGLRPGAFKVVPERTFLRSRRYTPFNAHRRRPGHERHVLTMGSVITVQLPEHGLSLKDLRAAFAKGVGAHRSEGLGRCLVAPQLLDEAKLQGGAPVGPPPGRADPSALHRDPTLDWMKAQLQAIQETEDALNTARTWRKKLRESHLVERLPASQWGRIRALAQRATTDKDGLKRLREAVLPPAEDLTPSEASYPNPSRASQARRGAVRLRYWGREHHGTSLGEELVELYRGALPSRHPKRALELLAGLMVRDRHSKETP